MTQHRIRRHTAAEQGQEDGSGMNLQKYMKRFPQQEKITLSDDRALSSMISSGDHPVRAIVNGVACVIYSSLKKDELKRVMAVHPEILRVTGEDGAASFQVGLDESMPGAVEDNLILFGGPVSAEGYATITLLLDPEEEDPGSLIYEHIREPLQRLAEIEESIFMMMRRRGGKERFVRTQIIRL